MAFNSKNKNRALAGCGGKIGFYLLLFILVGLGCEVGARGEDWFFDNISIIENPTYENLFVVDSHGNRRGRPYAQWKQVRMNNLGMRGEDVPDPMKLGCERWMFLGASETFGEPTMRAAEYPARVGEIVKKYRCVDILNVAYPGLSPSSFSEFYKQSLAQYLPSKVFIYPSTQLYLGDDILPKNQKPKSSNKNIGNKNYFSSRFYERLKDSVEIPAFIQKIRVKGWIEKAVDGHQSDWLFTGPPEDRLKKFESDMRELAILIRSLGAEPVFIIHAARTNSVARPDDMSDLYAMRVYVPRASEQVIAGFEYMAADKLRTLGAELNVPVIDAAKKMSGSRDVFIDLVHFSREGHQVLADLISQSVLANRSSEE